MPRNTTSPRPQPIFDDGSVTRDLTRFRTAHPSDSQLYKEIQKLLTKDVVSFSKSFDTLWLAGLDPPAMVHGLARHRFESGCESVSEVAG